MVIIYNVAQSTIYLCIYPITTYGEQGSDHFVKMDNDPGGKTLLIYTYDLGIPSLHKSLKCVKIVAHQEEEIGKKRGVWLKEVNDVVVIIGNNYNSTSNVNC